MSMSTANHYPLSPLAFVFPDYTRKELDSLVEDIRAHGLLEPHYCPPRRDY